MVIRDSQKLGVPRWGPYYKGILLFAEFGGSAVYSGSLILVNSHMSSTLGL